MTAAKIKRLQRDPSSLRLTFIFGVVFCATTSFMLILTTRSAPRFNVSFTLRDPTDHVSDTAAPSLQVQSRSALGRMGGEIEYNRRAWKAVFDSRRRRVMRFCGSVQNETDLRESGKVLTIPQLNLWYCAIPKCASTTLKYFLLNISGFVCSDDFAAIHRCAASTEFLLSLAKPSPPPAVSLIVVRNPWSRLVSAYVNKVVRQRSHVAKGCYAYHSADLHAVRPITFAQFCECLVAKLTASEPIDPHFNPQYRQCPFCEHARRGALLIASLETIKDEFPYVMRQTKAVPNEEELRHFADVFNSAPRRKDEVDGSTDHEYHSLYSTLTNATLMALTHLYRQDCEMFGYPLSPLQ